MKGARQGVYSGIKLAQRGLFVVRSTPDSDHEADIEQVG
jgi:hypothetical protein